MKRILLLAALALGASGCTSAYAGEAINATKGGGILVVSDAGTICNRTLYPGTTFVVTPLQKYTVQCDQAAYVGTDVAGCDAGTCLEVAAKEKLTTQINGSPTLTGYGWNWDGGSQATPSSIAYTGGWICVAPVTGASFAACKVFWRSGAE